MITLPLKPFPSPNPNSQGTVDPNIVRANDNALMQAVNQLYAAQGSGLIQSDSATQGTSLFDPRLSANDADTIIAAQVFGRYRA